MRRIEQGAQVKLQFQPDKVGDLQRRGQDDARDVGVAQAERGGEGGGEGGVGVGGGVSIA